MLSGRAGKATACISTGYERMCRWHGGSGWGLEGSVFPSVLGSYYSILTLPPACQHVLLVIKLMEHILIVVSE